jgi:Sec-independent protein translocase protein TatA
MFRIGFSEFIVIFLCVIVVLMATRLGTVRDVLGRAITALEAEGIMRMERSRDVILDPQRLLERGQV